MTIKQIKYNLTITKEKNLNGKIEHSIFFVSMIKNGVLVIVSVMTSAKIWASKHTEDANEKQTQ